MAGAEALANLTPAQLAQIPAAVPPPGVIPNLTNPHSDGYVLITVGSVLMAIMFLFLAMRFYAKFMILRKFTPDDYTTICAAIGTCLYYAVCVYGVTKAKFATHMWDISVAHTMSNEFLIPSFFLNWPTALVWAFAKTSFFLMYLDLFNPLTWLRVGCYIGLVVNWSFYIAVIAASIYYNAPGPGQTWLEGSQNARYAGSFNMTMPIASGSLILDVYILLLPVWVVWHLHLGVKRRLGVIAIFATGLFCCVASSLSIVYKHKLSSHISDFTWWTYPILLMALVEMCVGISASCMPATAAFWRHITGHGSQNATGRTLWDSKIFTPVRSLFRSQGSSNDSKDSSNSSWADGGRIYKSSHVDVHTDSESTRGLARDHEMTDFGGAQSRLV